MLTLKQVSEVLGIGRETIRRAILAGELPATPTSAPGGKAYLVTLEDAQAWFEQRPVRLQGAATVGASSYVAATEAEVVATIAASNSPSVPLAAHLAALEHGSKQADRLLNQVAHLQQQLDQERVAREQTLRRADILAYELTHHQRALSEAAESLAQARAATMQAEAQRLALEITSAQAADQVELNLLKLDTTRPEAKGWGFRVKQLLFRKIG